MPRPVLTMKILIRTDEGKQQEFTLTGTILNPDIRVGAVAYDIERAINLHTRYRAHANIEGEDEVRPL